MTTQDQQIIQRWIEGGIPFDRPTVDYASEVIRRMAETIATQQTLIAELVDYDEQERKVGTP